MIFGKVLEQEAQFTQRIGLHQMGVVDERDDHFAILIELMDLGEEPLFTLEIAAIGFGLEGVAKQAQQRGIGVKGAGDRCDHEPFGIVVQQDGFDGGFAGAGLAEQEAKAALLAMDQEGIKDVLLMS